jgi:pimeloyl-ACP methyl ester carboxylesterase
VPGDGSSRAVVLVHGLEGNKSDQHVLKTASVYSEAGYGVLMFDLRGHGESEGKRTTVGYQEVRDVRGALSWLKEEQGFEPGEVVLHGWSMGGATVLRSAPGTGLAAVVEESGYADLPLLLHDRLPESSGLPSFFNPGIFLMAKLFLDFDPWAVKPGEDAAKLSEEGVPLLIIHSTDDEVVPFEHAEMLAASYFDAELWQIQGYGHVEAYTHPEYRQRLLGLLEKVEAGEAA